jgi:hypothetical protein
VPPDARRTGLVLVSLVTASVLTACASGNTDEGAAPDRSPRPTDPATVPVPRIPSPAVQGTNRRLASEAAARMMARFPLPPDAIAVIGPPSGTRYLGRLRAIDGPVDRSLTRTRWWIVPRGYRRLIDWYVAHTPADRRSAQYPSGRTATWATLEWESHGSAVAHSPPSMVMTYSRLSPHRTAIRTDVTLAARDDRTAPTLVPRSVTRIEITRQAIDGPDASPRTATVSDQGDINAVVAAYDRAPGAYRSTEAFGCGSPVGIVYLYAVTFHWPRHTLVVDSGQPLCGIGRRLTRDDVRLRPRVESESPLDPVLKSTYDRH